jgi:hypothetical protein
MLESSLHPFQQILFIMSSTVVVDRSSNLTVHEAPNKQSSDVKKEDLSGRQYIRWNAEGVEKIPDGEEDDINAVAEQINQIQKAQWNVHRHCYSGTHARTHGIVKGSFIVPDNLPSHLKQGELFSHGGEYPIVARYSTEPGDPGLDVCALLSSLASGTTDNPSGPHPRP